MYASLKRYCLLFFLLSFLNTIQASRVDIHHIGVGQGDATLFVFADDSGAKTTNILIDTGNSNGKGGAVYDYLNATIAPNNHKIDVLVTSHLHSDHLGGTPRLLTLLSTNGWTVLKIIDRGGNYIPPHEDILCYSVDGANASNDPEPPEESEPGTVVYNTYVEACNLFPGARQTLIPGIELFHDLLNITNSPFQFWCLSNNACVVQGYQTTNTNCYYPNNENDLSFSWLLQYEGFKYFSGGDIGGADPYIDLEEDLCDAFMDWPDYSTFHFCGFKVSHHGSAHSTNEDFLSSGCTNPTLAIIPSALRSFNGSQIPTYETIDRITKVFAQLLYTFIKDDGIYYQGDVEQYNHVVLSVSNPGFGKNIPMQISQRKVDKNTLANEEVWGTKIINCVKSHNAPSSPKIAYAGVEAPTIPNTLDRHPPHGSMEKIKKIQINSPSSFADRKLQKLEQKERKKYQRMMRCRYKTRRRIKEKAWKLYQKQHLQS